MRRRPRGSLGRIKLLRTDGLKTVAVVEETISLLLKSISSACAAHLQVFDVEVAKQFKNAYRKREPKTFNSRFLCKQHKKNNHQKNSTNHEEKIEY